MRIVELRYRIMLTSFIGAGQWYFGQHTGYPKYGKLYETKEEADHIASITGTDQRLADVEEVEIPTTEENYP